MPLYELLCISRHVKDYKNIKDLVTDCAKHVMNAGGVVRSIESWGTRQLPQRLHRHQQWHIMGDYWTMHFDTNPRVLHTMNKRLKVDPMVLRWTMTKLGEKPEETLKAGEKTIDYIKVQTLIPDVVLKTQNAKSTT